MTQMQESVAVYRDQGPSAGLRLANSPSRHETMATFRELAGITRDYEQALMNRSLDRWERELMLAGRLNLATLLLGLLLAVIAATALARNERQRAETAAELQRQHDELKSQFDAQAGELTELARHLQHVQEEERARLSRGPARRARRRAAGRANGRDLDAATCGGRQRRRQEASRALEAGARPGHRAQAARRGGAASDAARHHGTAGGATLADRGNLQARRPAVHRAIPRRGAAVQPGRCDRAVPGRAGSPRQRGEARRRRAKWTSRSS